MEPFPRCDAALALTAGSAHAAALFSPLEDDSAFQKAAAFDTAFQALAQDPATASLTVVRANPDLVSNKASSISLNLGPGLDLVARQVSSYTTGSGSLVWSGVILDPGAKGLSFSPINTVMMVRDGNTITGNVHYNGEWLAIRPLRTGTHAIVSMDVAACRPITRPSTDLPVIKMPAAREPASTRPTPSSA